MPSITICNVENDCPLELYGDYSITGTLSTVVNVKTTAEEVDANDNLVSGGSYAENNHPVNGDDLTGQFPYGIEPTDGLKPSTRYRVQITISHLGGFTSSGYLMVTTNSGTINLTMTDDSGSIPYLLDIAGSADPPAGFDTDSQTIRIGKKVQGSPGGFTTLFFGTNTHTWSYEDQNEAPNVYTIEVKMTWSEGSVAKEYAIYPSAIVTAPPCFVTINTLDTSTPEYLSCTGTYAEKWDADANTHKIELVHNETVLATCTLNSTAKTWSYENTSFSPGTYDIRARMSWKKAGQWQTPEYSQLYANTVVEESGGGGGP